MLKFLNQMLRKSLNNINFTCIISVVCDLHMYTCAMVSVNGKSRVFCTANALWNIYEILP